VSFNSLVGDGDEECAFQLWAYGGGSFVESVGGCFFERKRAEGKLIVGKRPKNEIGRILDGVGFLVVLGGVFF
jgi:hypothetical protein